jgi:hypothetical protein
LELVACIRGPTLDVAAGARKLLIGGVDTRLEAVAHGRAGIRYRGPRPIGNPGRRRYGRSVV